MKRIRTYAEIEFTCPKCGELINSFSPSNLDPQQGIVDLDGKCEGIMDNGEECDNTCSVMMVGSADIDWKER